MGFRGKYKNKRDGNEPEIVAALEGCGFSVVRMDHPADLLCGFAGKDYLVEVKMPSAYLSGPQKIFFEQWRGSKTILRSVQDALEWANEIRGKK